MVNRFSLVLRTFEQRQIPRGVTDKGFGYVLRDFQRTLKDSFGLLDRKLRVLGLFSDFIGSCEILGLSNHLAGFRDYSKDFWRSLEFSIYSFVYSFIIFIYFNNHMKNTPEIHSP